MTAIFYLVEIRENGVRKTGLSPTINLLRKLSDNSPITPVPALTEVGLGLYKFSYDAAAYGEAACQIDAGAIITAEADRFTSILLLMDNLDRVVETGVSLLQLHRVQMAVLAGKATASTNQVIFRRPNGDAALTVTHDTNGNRSNVTIGGV